MNKHGRKIKKIIKYLTNIYNKEDVGGINQKFFRTLPELAELTDSYFGDFENKDEQNKAIAHNLEILNKLSFDKNEEGYTLYRDYRDKERKSRDKERKSNLNLSKDEHLKYASSIYHQLKDSFVSKLKEEGIDVVKNPYPLLFISGTVYQNFLKYTAKHIIDPYLDYSYLNRRLKEEGLIHKILDRDFMRILYEDMNLISKKWYEKFIDSERFRPLKKTTTAGRENNFNNIFLG
jgi:hypothetical protein|tara:strand:- start:524 stop:1225 length:702 start_codon:yes stop_codon:yes gene_type:complete